jgi:putative NIF3 family GTP cyclohydrolase 1 type 2
MDEEKVLKCGALCTGGGKSLVKELLGKADFYISGDLGHHDILSLSEMGIGFIELSHYDSEKIAAELLKERLDEKFKGETEVIISEKGVNPMKVI